MSLNFSFNCEQKRWKLLDVFEDGYLNHVTNKGRWNNRKDILVWQTDVGDRVAELILTQGYSCIIDYDQLDKVCEFSWSAAKDGDWGIRVIAYCKRTKKCILLHKMLYDTEVPAGYIIDHINTDFPEAYALDNRRCNIRFTKKNTHNVRKYKNNTSGEPNIIINKYGKYNVQVTLDQKRLHCPYYEPWELNDAKICRDVFRILLHDYTARQFSDVDLNKYSNIIIQIVDGTFQEGKLNRNVNILLRKLEKYDLNKYLTTLQEIRQIVLEQ